MGFEIAFFATESGRSQPWEFLEELPTKMRAQIRADIDAVGLHGADAPVSMRAIKGHRGLWEIRVGNYRVLYCVEEGVLWVLHICKKEDQKLGIAAAARRMKLVRGEEEQRSSGSVAHSAFAPI